MGTALAAGVSGFLPGAGLVHIPVTSFNAEKFKGIVRQRTDYSCGAASVATLLDDAYGLSLDERQVIIGMLQVSNYAEARAHGFSMLDMKHFAQKIGMAGVGYRMQLQTLFRVQVPSIVLIDVEGYEHFVVLRKATPTYVFIADPIRGNMTLPTNQFAADWNGIIFLFESPAYQRTNVLARAPLYGSPWHLASSVPPATYALTNAALMSIYIPAANRL